MADPTAGQIGLVEFELPHGHTGDVSFAEFELPHGHTGDLSWAELQLGNVATAGQVTQGWIETPNVATAGLVTEGSVLTPNVATAGRIGFTETIIPFIPTAGQLAQAWFEIRKLETAGRVGLTNLELPLAVTAGQIGITLLRIPKSYANSFVRSNGTVDVYRTANLSAIQAAGQITRIDVTSPGVYYTESEDIIITAVHSANTGDPENATLSANIGAQTTKAGTYRTTKGFLSADKFLQDETYYNDHTYVVRVAESFDRWKTIFKKVLHPAGFNLIGEFVAVLTPDSFTLTPEDAILQASIAGSGGIEIGGSATIVTNP